MRTVKRKKHGTTGESIGVPNDGVKEIQKQNNSEIVSKGTCEL